MFEINKSATTVHEIVGKFMFATCQKPFNDTKNLTKVSQDIKGFDHY